MLSELVRILPPPKNPREAGTVDAWPAVEAALRFSLPADYKQFINTYGTGGIDGWVFPFSPFAGDKQLNLEQQIQVRLAALRQLRDAANEHIPYPIHPELGGVIPWACTQNGDVLFWIAKGSPSDWTVCINDARCPEWEAFPYSMVAFLVKMLRAEVKVSIFPSDLEFGRGSSFVII